MLAAAPLQMSARTGRLHPLTLLLLINSAMTACGVSNDAPTTQLVGLATVVMVETAEGMAHCASFVSMQAQYVLLVV
jgi:hypothetical protein